MTTPRRCDYIFTGGLPCALLGGHDGHHTTSAAPRPEALTATWADRLRTLRRIAQEAQRTYVGRHWPSMDSMRRDGIGYGLVEDAARERFIRRFLYEFQPEFVVQMLDEFATLDAAHAERDDLRAAAEDVCEAYLANDEKGLLGACADLCATLGGIPAVARADVEEPS